jgi:cell surface protein SprA
MIDGVGGIPEYVKKDPDQHYIRLVQQTEVFKTKQIGNFQTSLTTFDLGYYPRERGPYNFDADLNQDGTLKDPATRWGGIQRSIEYSDFEQSNVEFIEFWVMDPFINRTNSPGGSLYINLGNVSEDVLKDSRKFFENGIPYPKVQSQLEEGVWGFVPSLQTQIVRAFDNDEAARAVQDVGYDGMNDEEERGKFGAYLTSIGSIAPGVRAEIEADPSNDNYRYYRGTEYDQSNAGILRRYKGFNNPHGNSPVTGANAAFSNAATNIPESEDINRDNTLNESEDYYQYRIEMNPATMQVGKNFIVNAVTSDVKLPNGNTEKETWYQYKIPIRDFDQRVGNIADFRSIRFIRLFLSEFQDSTILRFARFELGRNQWRRYQFSLQSPGENIPEEDQKNTEFAVTSVSLEENSDRIPVNYVIPPGVDRQQAAVANGQNVQLNEQAIALQVCGLNDGDARAIFKEVGVDMRQFGRLRMFVHAESQVNQAPLKDGDVKGFIRIGSDFTNNYYEYQIPLKITTPGGTTSDLVWPDANKLDLALDELVRVKTERNTKGLPSYVPYQTTDDKGNTIVVIGSPNLGDAKTIMLGILNPKKTNNTPADDGLPKCAEVWYNELRMTGLNESPGYAATGKVNVQLADLGSVRLSGSMHTQGYGNIDQKLNQRFRDNFYQYDASTNLNMGKVMPRNWGVQLPVFVGYSETISNPQYDPYDLDVKYKDELSQAKDKTQRDSMKKVAQDFTSITSVNVSNVRILGNPDNQNPKTMPWSVKNFDLSYAYNRQFKRNPLIEGDELTNHKLGLGYTYNIKSKPIEPFRNLIRSKSKWFNLIKDFNFNPLPANFTFRTDLNKIMDETQVRNVGDALFPIQPTYYKNFTWMRDYNLRWELTRSLSFDYHATNQSRVDEPYGRADNKEKRDTLWDNFKSFGRNTYYTQSFNTSYNLPLQKVPILDWTSLRTTYGANYNWTAASQLARSLGNTIGNTQNIQVNGELDFRQLYNKNKWLRAVNHPKPRANRNQNNNPNNKNPREQSKEPSGGGGRNSKDLSGGRENREPTPDAVQEDMAIDDGVGSNPDDGKAPKSDVPPPRETRSGRDKDTSTALIIAGVNAANLSDKQIDSLRKILKSQDEARKKAEKEKRKKERKARRKARKNMPAQVSDGERIAGRLLTMIKRTTINYSEQSGTVLPGYLDSTRYIGINNYNGQPGSSFVFGYQPGRSWLESKAADGKLSRDSLFNSQFQQQYSQNLTIQTTVEPIPDFRVDVNWNRTFGKTHSELFKDTGTRVYEHLNPYETGTFNITYIGLKTMFKESGPGIGTFQQFLDNRTIISRRLGAGNPYTGNTPDPNDPDYQKGYTQFSQDVLVSAFIAAYSGRSAESIPLIDYRDANNIESNPFKSYFPLPNWRVTYNGLTKIPFISQRMNNLVINHAYTGTLGMNSFVTSQYYQDLFGVGFPSFIDSNSGNYIPYFQVPNITITEQLNPLIGFDASFRNNLTARFEYRKSRTVSLSLIDYQVSETNSTDYAFGLGYRIRGLRLPFSILGVRTLKNDLNMKMDISLRDDKTSNNYLGQNVDITTRGQKVITISPSIDYIVSDKLTLRFFYDRRQSIPYVSSSYPITTTRAGMTLRFIFAQ